MHITGAIFDMDGTLLNSMDYWAIASSEYLRSKGIEPFSECDRHFLEDGMKVWYQTAVTKGLDADFESAYAGIYAIMDKYYNTEVKLKAGAYDMLVRLKENGVKMCLATATDAASVEKILTRLGIFSFFDGVFTAGQVGKGKRFPLIYEKALEFLGTDKESTYVFEDAYYAINTCYNAGFKIVGIYDKNVYVPKEQIIPLCDIYLDEDQNYNFDIE